jgi:DNA mismatch repair protein MSH5
MMEWETKICTRNFHFLVPDNGLMPQESIVAGDIGFTSQRGKFLALGGFIDLENRVSLGCAGAILEFLQKRTPWDMQDSLRVRNIEVFTLRGTM